MKCLECGHTLTEMRRELIDFTIDLPRTDRLWTCWSYAHTHYAGHCKNCLRDWEWDEIFKNDKVETTQPTRIFWG